MPHRIRLASLWDTTALPGGGYRHARKFGKPRLAAGERVALVGLGGPATVNGNVVPADGTVTDLLGPRNVVEVDTDSPTPPAGAAVEIHSP